MRGFIFNVISPTFIEVKLTKKCINECCHQGACDADVARWVNILRKDLEKIPQEAIRNHLQHTGGWDTEELKDNEQNLHRILWLLAGDCKETTKSCWAYIEGY